ncbi:hypothetical protein D3C85_281080 [compost metagenome]
MIACFGARFDFFFVLFVDLVHYLLTAGPTHLEHYQIIKKVIRLLMNHLGVISSNFPFLYI